MREKNFFEQHSIDHSVTGFATLTMASIGFSGGDTNLYGYVGQNPMSWVDPTGLKINDQTGGKIPAAIVNSPLYRQLDALPGTITIKIDNLIDAAGVTNFRLGDPNQTVRINENNQLSSYDLLDTYIHEFNHALLNFSFNGRTGEFFDTNILLPGQINKNLKGPGQCPNQ